MARVFAASLPYAGLMDDDGIVHQNGVNDADPPGPDDRTREPDGHQPDEPDGQRKGEPGNDHHEDAAYLGAMGEQPSSRSGSESSPRFEGPDSASRDVGTVESEPRGGLVGPTVEIRVTLSGYSGAEVVDILRTVGYRNAQS